MDDLTVKALSPQSLPVRHGGPPRTSAELPHTQLDQWPPAGMAAELERYALGLQHVRVRESRMASPATRALWVPDDLAAGPAEAFIDGHEFCHLHPLPQASLHLTLPSSVRQSALAAGWVRGHPGVGAGYMPETLVMVFGPRHLDELAVVLHLLAVSYRFALGELRENSAQGR
jgi:hypothetical protein